MSFFCEISPLYECDIGPIHENYCDWCEKIKKKPVKLQTFTHIIESHGVQRKQERHFENGNVITTHGIECNRDGDSDNFPKSPKLTPESSNPFKFSDTIKFTGFDSPVKSKYVEIMKEQFIAMRDHHPENTLFDDEDIYEPIATKISMEEFQMGKKKLFDSDQLIINEYGMRLK